MESDKDLELDCVICYDKIDIENHGVAFVHNKSKCARWYHLKCIAMWMEMNPVCPFCQCKIGKEDMITNLFWYNDEIDKQLQTEKYIRDCVILSHLNDQNDEPEEESPCCFII